MANSIFNKLFMKHSTPVEKFVGGTPVAAENLQKIAGALAARAAPLIGRAARAGVKAAKPYAEKAGKAGLGAAASAGKAALGVGAQAAKPHVGAALGAAKAGKAAGGLGAAASAAKPHLGAAGKAGLGAGGAAFSADMGARAAKKIGQDTASPPVSPPVSKQSFDTLFTKQNPALASQMAKRGLIFDRISHRWKKKPENRAQPSYGAKTLGYTSSYDKPTSQDFIWDGSEVQPVHSELDSDDSREMNFQRALKSSRGQNDPQRYFDAYQQTYGSEIRGVGIGSWLQLHNKLSNKEKRERNAEKEQKGFATINWRWTKDPTKKRLDKVEIGFLNSLTQENDHAGAIEHIAQFLGDKHLANRASKNRAMRDERRTSTDNRRWDKFNRKVYTEISAAMKERIQNISEVNRAM